MTGFPKLYAIISPLKNHQIGKKNIPKAYFIELINTMSSNFEIILREIQSGKMFGMLKRVAINIEVLFSFLRLGSLV